MEGPGHYAYFAQILNGISYYTHREVCDCEIGDNHWV